MEGTARFVVNTTLGIGGLFDVSTGFGLERKEEDFGQTLAVWGMGEGNYIHYPVLGPSSVRDTPGIVVGALTDVLTYVAALPLALLEIVDTRANLASAARIREESAFDPYVFTPRGVSPAAVVPGIRRQSSARCLRRGRRRPRRGRCGPVGRNGMRERHPRAGSDMTDTDSLPANPCLRR